MMLASLWLLAQQGAPGGQVPRGNLLSALLPFILVFVIFYFLIIMPSRKKQRRHESMVANLKAGDRIITSGGIFGTVMGVQNDRIEVKVAANVKIEVAKNAIGAVLGAPDAVEKRD